MTLARLRKVAEGWSVTVCSGGHPLPLLAGPGVDPAPIGQHGALLGVFDKLTLRDDVMHLRIGDRLVFFTDGVTEGRRGVEFYGEERLEAAAGDGGSAGVVVERILQDVLYFQGGAPADDIAIVVVQVP